MRMYVIPKTYQDDTLNHGIGTSVDSVIAASGQALGLGS